MPFPMPFPPSHRCTRALGALGLVASLSLLSASGALAQQAPKTGIAAFLLGMVWRLESYLYYA